MLQPVAGQPGHFRLSYKKASYTMIPEETSSGAVRLEDKKAGVVWLQIPAKSMLMDARAGQRRIERDDEAAAAVNFARAGERGA